MRKRKLFATLLDFSHETPAKPEPLTPMTFDSAAETGVISPEVVTLIPYALARRFRAVAIRASAREVTVLTPNASDSESLAELQSATGLTVVPLEASSEQVESLLDHLSGALDTTDLWLQRRHIHALSRLVDHSANVGQVEVVRPLVDRALEFAPYSAEVWLMKARVAAQRKEVIQALTVASQIAPNDRRILRWIHSLQELEEPETPSGPVPSTISQPAIQGKPRTEGTGQRLTRQHEPSIPEPESRPMEASPAADMETESKAPPPGLQVVQPRDHAAGVLPDSQSEDHGRVELGAKEQAPSGEVGTSIDNVAFGAAQAVSRVRDIHALMRVTAESLQAISRADSVSVYFRSGRAWDGWSSHPHLQSQRSRALPQQNRLAAQAVRQGLPIVVSDTDARVDDVGPLVRDTGIRSFALIPIRTNGNIGGLAYLNFNAPDRAGDVFDSDTGRGLELVLNCAGTSVAAIHNNQALDASAALDSLTAAYTMTQFERLLGAELERARRYRFSISILSIDVDDFSHVNETYGRVAGDEVLRQLAIRVHSLERLSDVLARRGDDEFVVMLPQTTAKGAELVSQRIHSAFAEPVTLDGSRVDVRLSIGVATFPDQADEGGELLNAAEIALFRAKAQGKGRTSLADTLSLGI